MAEPQARRKKKIPLANRLPTMRRVCNRVTNAYAYGSAGTNEAGLLTCQNRTIRIQRRSVLSFTSAIRVRTKALLNNCLGTPSGYDNDRRRSSQKAGGESLTSSVWSAFFHRCVPQLNCVGGSVLKSCCHNF